MSNVSNEQPVLATETIPKTWPGAFGLYAYSKRAIMTNLSTYAAVFVLSLVIGALPSFVDQKTSVYLLVSVMANVVAVWFDAALVVIVLQSVKKRKISLDDSLQQGLAMLVKYFLQSLLLGLIALACILCLVVPLFFILPRLALAQFFLFDKNMGVTESIKASWESTRGHVGKVWGIIGASLAMALLMLTIIGIPFSVYFIIMYSAANAILYFWLIKHGAETATSPNAVNGPVSPIK